jgi:hypothetical protein
VAQGVGPEFKPPYSKKQNKTPKTSCDNTPLEMWSSLVPQRAPRDPHALTPAMATPIYLLILEGFLTQPTPLGTHMACGLFTHAPAICLCCWACCSQPLGQQDPRVGVQGAHQAISSTRASLNARSSLHCQPPRGSQHSKLCPVLAFAEPLATL